MLFFLFLYGSLVTFSETNRITLPHVHRMLYVQKNDSVYPMFSVHITLVLFIFIYWSFLPCAHGSRRSPEAATAAAKHQNKQTHTHTHTHTLRHASAHYYTNGRTINLQYTIFDIFAGSTCDQQFRIRYSISIILPL